METIKLLNNDWGYPVCDNPEGLQRNIDSVYSFMPSIQQMLSSALIHFTGIGTSGAMLLAALSARLDVQRPSIHPHFVLLRKPSDDTAQGRTYVSFNQFPIIIVDDHICDGGTMKKIAAQLHELGVLHQVKGVIANSWSVDYNHLYLNRHCALLPELFPSIKFWIY